MNMTTPLDGLTTVALALAVILSGIVSLVGSAARKQAVVLAAAQVRDLCELTGITNPNELQDVFGPPNLNRVWQNLTLERVLAERRPLGVLISGRGLDWACIGAGVLAFFTSFALVEIALLAAFVLQAASWVLAARLPR